MKELTDWFLQPLPWRIRALAKVSRSLDLFSYKTRLLLHSMPRTEYGHCLLAATKLGKALGHPAITAIEFGVGCGNGLVALGHHAVQAEKLTDVKVAVVGFDTGKGSPPPVDYRDLPYFFQDGCWSMDEPKLRKKLGVNTELIIGPVSETLPIFMKRTLPPPIGFISFDMDYYSSTTECLKVLETYQTSLLPRVVCYFGSVVGGIEHAHCEHLGQLLAIDDFNVDHNDIKLCQPRGLRHFHNWYPRAWHEQVYIAHSFLHQDYSKLIRSNPQETLR